MFLLANPVSFLAYTELMDFPVDGFILDHSDQDTLDDVFSESRREARDMGHEDDDLLFMMLKFDFASAQDPQP
jgi:hypothetical protein